MTTVKTKIIFFFKNFRAIESFSTKNIFEAPLEIHSNPKDPDPEYKSRILEFLNLKGKYDIKINVQGGGLTGQAGAIQLGIARALLKIDEEFRSQLKSHGLLTRDAREVERKKYGQPGARKKFQFSKR